MRSRTGPADSGGRYGLLLLHHADHSRLTGQVFLATLVARLVTAYRAPARQARHGT